MRHCGGVVGEGGRRSESEGLHQRELNNRGGAIF